MKMKKKSVSKLYLYGAIGCVAAIACIGYLYCFSAFSKSSETKYVYIDTDDNIDSVYNKVEPFAKSIPMQALRTLTHHSGYADHIRTGRYAIHPGDGAFKVWRHLKNGLQEPMNLTVPSVRTIDKLSAELSKKLMLDSLEIRKALTDEAPARSMATTQPPSPACSSRTPTTSIGTYPSANCWIE